MADTSLAEKKIGILIWLASNFWQSKLRLILKKHNFSLNEYLILESISSLIIKNELISQVNISSYAGIDVSVVSTSLKSLEKKLMVKKIIDKDNRIKIIKMLPEGSKIFNILYPLIISEEEKIFSKLQDEKNNFTNSLRLILGKKIRIRLNNKI